MSTANSFFRCIHCGDEIQTEFTECKAAGGSPCTPETARIDLNNGQQLSSVGGAMYEAILPLFESDISEEAMSLGGATFQLPNAFIHLIAAENVQVVNVGSSQVNPKPSRTYLQIVQAMKTNDFDFLKAEYARIGRLVEGPSIYLDKHTNLTRNSVMSASKNSLISIKHFRQTYFKEGSMPSQATVRRWIEAGSIPGRIIPGSGELRAFYVDADAWERSIGFSDVDEFLKELTSH